MHTKLHVTLRWVLVLLLVMGCILYLVPWSTPISLTLDAAKLDQNGNVIGTAQITINGKRLDYLIQKNRLVIQIDPFDDWDNFMLSDDADTGKKGVINTFADKFEYVNLFATSPNPTFCDLYFTRDFNHIALNFLNEEGRCLYVASAESKRTPEEVIEYFRAIVPGWFKTS